MGNLAIQRGGQTNQTRGVVYDAGEKLKAGVDSILRDDTNPAIDAQIANISADLRRNGVRNTRFVGQLLYCFRGVQQRVPGDLARFKQAVKMAQNAGVLGPRGAQSLLAKVGVVEQQSKQQANTTPGEPCRMPDKFENVYNNPLVNMMTGGSGAKAKTPADLFKPKAKPTVAPVAKKPVAQTEAKKPEVSPALERAITSIDVAAKSMPEGVAKSSLEAVQSALELAKEAQQKGDSAAYTRAIAELGSKTFDLVGSIVKTYGQSPELAAQAAGQLGKVAGVLGKVAGPLKALDSASKLFAGKTLGGTPVDKNARAEALYDLASSAMPGPIQAAMAINKVVLEQLYTNLGVPVQRSIEAYGLKQLFAGKTPEQMKAIIDALPTDDANSNATVRKLLNVFDGGGFGNASTSTLWRKFMSERMSGYSTELKAMVNQDPRRPNSVPDMLRETVADRMKSAAIAFINEQQRQARGNW